MKSIAKLLIPVKRMLDLEHLPTPIFVVVSKIKSLFFATDSAKIHVRFSLCRWHIPNLPEDADSMKEDF